MRALKIILLIIATGLFSCNSNAQSKMTQTEYAKHFVDNFATYKMDIKGAGLATLPKASLSKENALSINYAYHSEGENRQGAMTLTFNEKTKRFEGNWKTNADNGNVYSGSLYFVFKENGEADGYYKYAGSDYMITIFIPKKK
jgi:hypothetical protein